MGNETTNNKNIFRSLYILAFVNVLMWTLSIIALIFVIQRCPGAKWLFVILAGGTGIGISLLSMIYRKK